MTAADRPAWWRPGLSQRDIDIWEAAERAEEQAEREAPLQAGDDVVIRLKALFGEALRQTVLEHLEHEKRDRRPQSPAA